MLSSSIQSSSNSAETLLRRQRHRNNNASTRFARFISLPLNVLLGVIVAFGAWNGFVSLRKLQAEDSVILSLSSRHMQEETMSLFAKSKSVAAKVQAAHTNSGKDYKDAEVKNMQLKHASDSLSSTSTSNTEPVDPAAARRLLYERLANSTPRRGKSFSLSTPESPCSHITGKEKSIARRSNSSTVEFTGCCGLGHRLLRMSGAAHVAQTLNAQFYGHWGCCNEKEVFTEMFGDTALLQPFPNDENLVKGNPRENQESNDRALLPGEQQHQSVQPNHLMFRFEVAGFEAIYKEKRRFLNRTRGLIDTGNESTCPVKCSPNKIRSDYRFYTALMQRYRQRHVVEAFVREHFTDRLALGLHIRAGNDEKGDFERKGRVIADKQAFVKDTIAILNQLVANANAAAGEAGKDAPSHMPGNTSRPPILFIATDTPHYIDAFRHELKYIMPVVDLPHVIRQTEGQGVLFGEMATVTTTGEDCLKGWQSAFEDMMILSQTDIVLSPKQSSFTQTMPLSIVLGRPKHERTIAAPFCETIKTEPTMNATNHFGARANGNSFQCYKSVQDWCCRNEIPRASYFDVRTDWRDSL